MRSQRFVDSSCVKKDVILDSLFRKLQSHQNVFYIKSNIQVFGLPNMHKGETCYGH